MNQKPSVFRFLSQIWLQNFRRQPVRTLLGSVLSVAVIVGLFFLSVFVFVSLIVIGLVALLYFKLTGGGARVFEQRTYRYEMRREPESRTGLQRDILDGEFREVSKSDGENTGNE